ncbi:hypothetical protein TrVFT333_007650 [Trichoderma virens FT-333]|nr:hypothetical protein TrVFT333_007650 [Trichoderma virens FT-333]
MRLINTQTLDLEEFFDIYVPEYAILSHTWADGEISLQEWADRKNRRFKPGYQKIIWTCEEATRDNLQYVWVDTNCIDKTSSAELSEAINSMFKWYRRARICYAYLEDVPHMSVPECEDQGSAFRTAKWFTRGWTLQELIAPPEVKFFSQDWRPIGTKADLALCISEITGIAWTCLLKPKFSKSNPLRGYSVAQRLSWASRRSTTRIEDQAYSLIGLFDITMPLLYGEGHEAFTRFLGEIIGKYPDHSFFASQLRYVDFLPRSPKEFCDSRNVVIGNSPQLQKHYTPVSHSYPFQLTNTGLQITLPIVPTLVPHFVFGVLDCWEYDMGSTQATRSVSRIWIPLMQKDHPGLRHYSRLLWPEVFCPVRLIRKHRFMQVAQASEDEEHGDQATATDPASLLDVVQHVDIVSMDIHESILIKNPYATTVNAPRWQPRLAGSPFLIPRKRRTGTTDDGSETPNGDDIENELYGVVVVFKKRKCKPASCKIVRAWNYSQQKDLHQDDFQDVTDIDAKDNVFVAVQKLLCPSKDNTEGLEPRFLGLVQVVFDKADMMDELRLSSNGGARAAEGILQYFGVENSDEEAGSMSMVL